MSKYDSIRFYHDEEVNSKLLSIANHPMFKSLIHFTFPDKSEDEVQKTLLSVHSIQEFHEQVIFKTMERVLETSSEGLTVSGFEKLDPNTSYLFISNHRDILLDTSLLNVCLLKQKMIMTASAVGNNLVQKPFLMNLAKINRNFIVQRDVSPRELLMSSKLMSQYIGHLIKEKNRSVWIAQREGRTKDGNDATHSGVLKMMAMASDQPDTMDYLKSLRIVPVSISYEYDPTDKLKMPQIIAQLSDIEYIKDKNEDFINLMSGVVGQKKRIHIHVGGVLDEELDAIKEDTSNSTKRIQALTKIIDRQVIENYRLWPTNYIAFDLLYKTNQYEAMYTDQEKQLFLRRLEMRVDKNDLVIVQKFLEMYANPVVNKNNL